jgi:hypothetical protein
MNLFTSILEAGITLRGYRPARLYTREGQRGTSWLNGTFHGVSAKHLPCYAREWNYRFNRRRRIADLSHFLLSASRHPINHNLPPARRRHSTRRRVPCVNRIGK